MFWRFNLLTPSQIDTLLDQEDVKKGSVTLEDILDEDDVLQECKGQNQKLLDFLVRPENMEELVNLVIQEPEEDKEEKIRFKYPNTACELLTSDVPAITDQLAGEETLLNKVYSFLESEATLNPLQASFFGKVMGLLISRKSELMLNFLKSKEDFISHLLRHIGTSAIMDVLLRLITCIENTETRNSCISWLNEQSIIQKLVGLIDPVHSEEKHCNASQCLCDIIRMGRDQMSHLQEKADNDPLLAAIESEEVVADLLEHMFSSETKVESVLVNGLQIIQTLLEFRKIGPEGCAEQMTTLDTERIAHGVNNTLAAVSPRLNHLHQLLVNPPRQHYHAMPTTIGHLDPPLGNTRLQVVRLITSLLITNTHSVNQELANLGTIAVIIDLFFKYSWNNFLHTQAEQCLCTILNMTPPETEDGQPSNPLLDKLLEDSNFIEKILNAWEDNENNQNKPGATRPGYMGHLTRVANYVSECSEKGTNAEKIQELFKNYSEEQQQRWGTFVSGTLAEVNKTNTADLVGSPTVLTSSDSEDPDFSHIPFPQESTMQQAFSDYQLQQMTSTFIDQFGFNEDEFAEQEERVDAPFTDKISSINFEINGDELSNAATLFQQSCNDRMQQFDDPDSDEDLWEDKEITFSKSQGGRSSPHQSTPQNQSRNESDSDEDQNSEGSTDSEEELDSPRRIYQVPSSSTSSTCTTTTTTVTAASSSSSAATTATSTTPSVENMDVDSSEAWADFSKAPTSGTAVAMDTSPWDQQAQNSSAAEAQSSTPESSSNAEEKWANFDQMFPTSTSPADSNNKKTVNLEGEQEPKKENWADFTNFEEMESSDNKVVSKEETEDSIVRSVSPIAMDTNETPSTTSNRMAQYMVSSGAADSSQQPTSSSSGDEDLSSPPPTPRQAWDTPREDGGEQEGSVPTTASTSSSSSPPNTPEEQPSKTSPSVPADTISSSEKASDSTSLSENSVPNEQNGPSTENTPQSEAVPAEDHSSSEVSSSTSNEESQPTQSQTPNKELESWTSTDVDTGLPVTSCSENQQTKPSSDDHTISDSIDISQSCKSNPASSTSIIENSSTTIPAALDNAVDKIDILDEIADDGDLSDNFNFLAGGLMKSPSSSSNNEKISSDSQVNDSNTDDEASLATKKIEDVRAQAHEALKEFSSTTGTGSTQNGPV